MATHTASLPVASWVVTWGLAFLVANVVRFLREHFVRVHPSVCVYVVCTAFRSGVCCCYLACSWPLCPCVVLSVCTIIP